MPDRSSIALGHVHLTVRDVDRAIAFYRTHLDLTVTEREGPYAFLSWGSRHHDVALQEVGVDAAGPADGVGLYHAAFEVDDCAALGRIYDRLRAADVPVDPVDHGISTALYFDDPDGNGLEVYVDTRSAPDQRWGGRSQPFDPRRSRGEREDDDR